MNKNWMLSLLERSLTFVYRTIWDLKQKNNKSSYQTAFNSKSTTHVLKYQHVAQMHEKFLP